MKFRIGKDLKEKIEEIAEFVMEVFEEDYYLLHPCRDFLKTDEALRVRKSDRFYLTYKGPRIDEKTKTRDEIEVEVKDLYRTLEIFKRLGFDVFAKVSKLRRIYRLGEFKICIDDVEGLGEFIEIEVEGELKDREKVLNLAEDLGLKDPITKSYLELVLESKVK